jgi:hypothetical protein
LWVGIFGILARSFGFLPMVIYEYAIGPANGAGGFAVFEQYFALVGEGYFVIKTFSLGYNRLTGFILPKG